MTRFFTGFLAAFLLLSASAVAQVSLTIGSMSNVQNGQQVCLNVTPQNFTNIVGMQFSITYNPAMLQLTAINNLGLPGFSTGGNFGMPIPGGAGMTAAGVITVTWTDPNAAGVTVANGTTLFTLCFNALTGTGSTTVNFSNTPTAIEFTNSNLQIVPFNGTPGTVSFAGGGGGGGNPTGFNLTIASANNVQNGQQVCLNVTANNFTNIVGMQFSITYSASMLQLTSVSNFGLPGLTAGGNFGLPIPGGAGSTPAGTITMTWTDPNAMGVTVANGTTIFTLCFNALVGTGSTTVNFSNMPTAIEVTNSMLQNVPFNGTPGTVTFGSGGGGGGGGNPTGFTLTIASANNVQNGQQVCLNVTAANFTNIVGMQFSINYNPAMLQLTAVNNLGLPGLTLGGNFGLPIPGGAGLTTAGNITVTWTDPNAAGVTVANGTTIFTLCFNALVGTGATNVNFSNVPTPIEVTNSALQVIPFNGVPGTVNFGGVPQPEPITVTVAGANNVQNGQQVCLNVTVTNFTNIDSLQLTINYAAAMLQFVSVDSFGLTGLTAANFNTATAGVITLNWIHAPGQTLANGARIFRLCFTALTGSGSTQVTIPNALANNTSNQNVTVNTAPGTVNFGAPAPNPLNLVISNASNVQNGQQFCLTVTAQQFVNLNSLQLTINYNASHLQFVSVGAFGIPGLTAANFNTGTAGTITLDWTNTNGQTLSSGAVLFNMCFTAQVGTGTSMVTFGNTAATNANGQTVNVGGTPGTVTFTALNGFNLVIGSASNVTSGQQVCLNVTTVNFTNIVGMQFSINYNPAMLQLTAVNNLGLPGFTLGGNFGLPIPGGAGLTTAGNITVTWTDPNAAGVTVANGTTIFTLCFNALANTGSTQVTFSNVPTSIEITNSNLQVIPFNSVPGTVTFGAGPPPPPTPLGLTIANASNVQNGQQFCLNVTVGQGFQNIDSLQLTIAFNSALLSFVSVDSFGLTGLTAANFNTSTPGLISLNWIHAPGQTLASGARIFRICFTAQVGTGSTTVSFGSLLANNTTNQTVQVSGTAGNVTFTGGSTPTPIAMSIGSASNVQNGQQVCLNVTVDEFTNITSLTLNINYMASMLQFTAVDSFGLAGLTAANFNTSTAGTIIVTWNNATPQTLANGARVFRLCFTALTGTGSTQITFGNTAATTTGGQAVQVNGTPGTVSFGSTPPPASVNLFMGSASNVQNGQQVCLSVTVQNFTDISSLNLTINYNPALLQFVAVDSFGLPGLTAANFNTGTAGAVTLNWSNATAQTLTNGARVFRVCFTALTGTGSTQVTFGNATAANASSQPVTVNGAPGTVSFTTLSGFTLVIGSANNVQQGQIVCLPVTVASFTGIVGMQFSITYNPAHLRLVSVGGFGLPGLSTGGNFGLPIPGGAGSTAAGTITTTWTDPNATGVTLANGATIFVLCFEGLVNVNNFTTQVAFSNTPTPVEITNAALQIVPFNSIPGTVTFTTGNTGNPPAAPTIDTPANITNVTCFGASTGAIDITVSGGTGSYTYQWDFQNRTTQDLTNIPAGTYSVTVTDANGQTARGSFTVTQPAMAINIIGVPTHVACTGQNTGAINVTVSGGASPYIYAWSGGLPATPNPGNLAAGSYTLTVTDDNGCTATQQFIVNQPAGPPLTLASTVMPVACAGASTGAITLNITGGTPQYTIMWCCNLPANQTNVTGLAAGTYTVTVTDNNGCTATRTMNVGQNPPLQITSITPGHINAGNDGAVNITVTGGSPGYNFQWTGPQGFSATTANLTGLSIPGQYCVTVRDNLGCTANACTTVLERMRFANVVITRACSGTSTGSIQISVAGGTPPYIYMWNPGGPGGPTRSDIAGGTYNVTVTDNAGEQLVGSFVVDNLPVANVMANITNASGNITDANGALVLNVTGGTPGYTFLWNTGATTPNLSNLLTGEYCVTVTDQAGCRVERCFNVGFNPGPLVVLSAQTTPVTCPGDSNGTASIRLNGGLPPFTFVFSDNFTQTVNAPQLNRNGLPAGTLNFTVTDAAGTTVNGSINIATSSVVTVTNTVVVHDTEDPGCIGSITLTLAGGTPPLQLQWNTPNTGGPSINNLCAGTFIATVTDANNCVFVLPPIEVNTFGLSATTTPAPCPESQSGAIALQVSGGRAPYTFEWRNAAGVIISTNGDLTNVMPGTYTVRVTESSGNVLVRTYTVGSQSNLALDVDVTSNYNGFDVSCHDASDARLQAVAFNGQGNYTFEWRRNGVIVGGSGSTLTNAAPGDYQVRVTDGLGCTVQEALTVTAPAPLTITSSIITPSCVGGNDGQIFVMATGGVSNLPYTFEWDNGALGPRISFLRAGSYTVSVNDVNNCRVITTINLPNPAPINVTVTSTPATDGCNGAVLATVNGGTGPYTYTWSTGQVTTEPFLSNLCPGEYFVIVTDSRGCRPNPNMVSGTVRDRRTPCLDIRTVITPDGDGLNEEFLISCVDEFRNNHLEIYNRWGQLVYEVDNYDNTWRGTTRNGAELPDGPYYFIFEYDDVNGVRQQFKGSITLLRK